MKKKIVVCLFAVLAIFGLTASGCAHAIEQGAANCAHSCPRPG